MFRVGNSLFRRRQKPKENEPAPDLSKSLDHWPTTDINEFASGASKLDTQQVSTLAALSGTVGGLASLSLPNIAGAFGGAVPEKVSALIDSIKAFVPNAFAGPEPTSEPGEEISRAPGPVEDRRLGSDIASRWVDPVSYYRSEGLSVDVYSALDVPADVLGLVARAQGSVRTEENAVLTVDGLDRLESFALPSQRAAMAEQLSTAWALLEAPEVSAQTNEASLDRGHIELCSTTQGPKLRFELGDGVRAVVFSTNASQISPLVVTESCAIPAPPSGQYQVSLFEGGRPIGHSAFLADLASVPEERSPKPTSAAPQGGGRSAQT